MAPKTTSTVGIAYEDILIRELAVPVLKGFARLALGSEYKLPTTKEALIHVVEGIANKKLETSNTDLRVSKYPAIAKAFSSEERAARAALAEEAVRSYMTYIPYAPKKTKKKLETSNTPDKGPKYWLN